MVLCGIGKLEHFPKFVLVNDSEPAQLHRLRGDFIDPVLRRVFPSRFMLEQLIPQPEFAFFGLLAAHVLLS